MSQRTAQLLGAAGILTRNGDDPATLSARRGFQSLSPHRPDLVAYPASTDDVVRIARCAAETGMPVAVAATGHGRRAPEAEGGILVSMERMRDVRSTDDGTGVRVRGGARWQDVVAHASPRGIALPHGSAPGVGVTGYLLGGGFSIFGAASGMAANSITSLTCVTASGDILVHDQQAVRTLLEESWKTRPDLGIVTEVTLTGWPADELSGGGFTVPGEAVPWLMSVFPAWAESLPEHITPSMRVMKSPSLPSVPEIVRGRPTARVRLTALNDEDGARHALDQLRQPFAAVDDDFQPLPWSRVGQVYDEPTSPRPHVGRNRLSRDAPDLTALWPDLARAHSAPLVLDVRHFGSAAVEGRHGHITAPGGWITGLVSPSPTDVGETRQGQGLLLDAAVANPLGAAANFEYGPLS